MARRPTPWFRKARNAWFVTIGGTQHNLGPDKKLAFEKFHKLMAQERTEKVLGESFAALADRYLEWVHKKRSPDTYEWYRYRIERFVQRHPNLLASEVRPHHIEDWTDSYEMTVTSKRNYMRSVKRCLSWAIKQGFLKENPLSALEIPSGDHKEVVFTQAEVENLLSYVRSPALMDLIVTTIETGCRPQESLRVKARHVDLQNKRWVLPKKESKMKRMAHESVGDTPHIKR